MNKFSSYKFSSKSIIVFICMLTVSVTSSFALGDSQKLLYINKDNVKTKVNIVNSSKNDTNVTINVTGNNKKSIKEEFSVDKLSKKEVSIDLLKDISKIDDKNKKIESGVLDVKSDNGKDPYVSVSYSFKNNQGNIDSVVDYKKNEIKSSKSYFIINKFIYEKLEKAKLYLYNLDDKDFEGKIERYSSIGKLKDTLDIEKIKKGEERVFDFGKAKEDTYVIIPSDKQKYIAFIKLEYKNGRIEIIKPSATFKKTSLIKSEGVLTLFNTSKDYMLIGYEVYDKGKLEFQGEFAFIPKQQKFIDLGEQTSFLESPVIRLVSSNLSKNGKFKNSKIVAQINTKIKKKSLVNNFYNIKGEAGVKFTSLYDSSTDKKSFLNIYNEEGKDANVTVKSKKGDLSLSIKSNDILQVPLKEVVKNIKENEVLNVESKDTNVSLSFDNLKKGNKKSNINILKSNNIKDLLVNQNVYAFNNTINKKTNFKSLETGGVKTLQDKNLGFGENQKAKIEQAVKNFVNNNQNGNQNNIGNGTQNNNIDNNSIPRCPDRKANEAQCVGISENCGYVCPQGSHIERIVCNLVGFNQTTTVTRISCPCDDGYVSDGASGCKKCGTDEVIMDGKCVPCKGNGLFIKNGECRKCKEGRYYDGEKCVVCEGQVNDRGECIECAKINMYWDADFGICKCKDKDSYKYNGWLCKSCGDGQANEDGAGCLCNSDAIWENNTCVKCPEGHIADKDNKCVIPECEATQWRSSKGCKDCGNGDPRSDKKGCICSPGSGWNGSTCVECKNGYTQSNLCKPCGEGTVIQEGEKQGLGCTCNSNAIWKNDTCVECCEKCFVKNDDCHLCTHGKPNKNNDGCDCDPGYGWNEDRQYCEKCQGETYSQGNKCNECPNGMEPNKDHTSCNCKNLMVLDGKGGCSKCKLEENEYYDNGQCKKCSDGFASLGTDCKECKKYHQYAVKVGVKGGSIWMCRNCGINMEFQDGTCQCKDGYGTNNKLTNKDNWAKGCDIELDDCGAFYCPVGKSCVYTIKGGRYTDGPRCQECDKPKQTINEGNNEYTICGEDCNKLSHRTWNDQKKRCECEGDYYEYEGECKKATCGAHVPFTSISIEVCKDESNKSFTCCEENEYCKKEVNDKGVISTKCECLPSRKCGYDCCLSSQECVTYTKKDDGNFISKRCEKKCDKDSFRCNKYFNSSKYLQTWCCPNGKQCGDEVGECLKSTVATLIPVVTETIRANCTTPVNNQGTPTCTSNKDCCGGECLVRTDSSRYCFGENAYYGSNCVTDYDCYGLKCELGKCTQWIVKPEPLPTMSNAQKADCTGSGCCGGVYCDPSTGHVCISDQCVCPSGEKGDTEGRFVYEEKEDPNDNKLYCYRNYFAMLSKEERISKNKCEDHANHIIYGCNIRDIFSEK